MSKTLKDFKMENSGIGERKSESYRYTKILSKLIEEAGRWCEENSSDLFMIWDNMIDIIENDSNYDSGKYLFGFKRSGIDNAPILLEKMKNGERLEYIYRAIWVLDVSVKDSDVIMQLGKYEMDSAECDSVYIVNQALLQAFLEDIGVDAEVCVDGKTGYTEIKTEKYTYLVTSEKGEGACE